MAFRRRLFSHNPFYDLYNSGKSIGLPPHTGCRLKPCARRSSAPAVRTPVRRRPRLRRQRCSAGGRLQRDARCRPTARYAAVGRQQGPRRLLPYHQLRPHTQKPQNHLPLQRKQDAAKRHPLQERANYAAHSNRINEDKSPTHGRSMVCCASEIVSKTGEHYDF